MIRSLYQLVKKEINARLHVGEVDVCYNGDIITGYISYRDYRYELSDYTLALSYNGIISLIENDLFRYQQLILRREISNIYDTMTNLPPSHPLRKSKVIYQGGFYAVLGDAQYPLGVTNWQVENTIRKISEDERVFNLILQLYSLIKSNDPLIKAWLVPKEIGIGGFLSLGGAIIETEYFINHAYLEQSVSKDIKILNELARLKTYLSKRYDELDKKHLVFLRSSKSIAVVLISSNRYAIGSEAVFYTSMSYKEIEDEIVNHIEKFNTMEVAI